MKLSAIIGHLLKRKVATIIFITVSIAAFATLGEGGRKNRNQTVSSTSGYSAIKPFSLKSGYNYRGCYVFNIPANRYIIINANVTYHKGNNTYILPLKRKVLLDKISFKPAPPRNR